VDDVLYIFYGLIVSFVGNDVRHEDKLKFLAWRGGHCRENSIGLRTRGGFWLYIGVGLVEAMPRLA